MSSDSLQPVAAHASLSQIEPVYRLYAALSRTFLLDAEQGLGGKLLFAGEIGGQGRNLLYAANIAGAASLGASADSAVQRQAIRDGVIDFLVTSLEEALRILKNEVRKRQTVSVGVAADPHRLADQMLERGVLPDLLPPALWTEQATGLDRFQADKFLIQFEVQGARRITPPEDEAGEFVAWSVDRHFARWLPRLDGCAQSVLPADDRVRQRWLRLAPRYLGRMAQREHGVVLDADEAAQFAIRARELAASHATDADETVNVEIRGGESL